MVLRAPLCLGVSVLNASIPGTTSVACYESRARSLDARSFHHRDREAQRGTDVEAPLALGDQAQLRHQPDEIAPRLVGFFVGAAELFELVLILEVADRESVRRLHG